MEEQDYYSSHNDGENNEPVFGKMVGSALAYFFAMLAFILFVCPFSFWKSATMRLYRECKRKTLMNFTGTSRWPFLTFLKKIFFEFLIDGIMFISYFVGVIIVFVILIKGGGFIGFLGALIVTYYSPLGLSLIRDVVLLLLLPLRKFLSWVSKPAQQIDVDFRNHTK